MSGVRTPNLESLPPVVAMAMAAMVHEMPTKCFVLDTNIRTGVELVAQRIRACRHVNEVINEVDSNTISMNREKENLYEYVSMSTTYVQYCGQDAGDGKTIIFDPVYVTKDT